MVASSPSEILPELDQKSQDLLAALADLEPSTETVTTSDLIEATGISRPQIHYRLNEYLEPYGLVDTHQPTSENPGKAPPKEIASTDRGRDVVDKLDSPAGDTDIGDRLTRLEEQMDAIQSTVQDLEGQSSASGDSEVDADLDAVQEQIGSLAMELEDLKEDPLFQDGVRAELDAVRTGTLAIRDYLFEVQGAEDEIVERSKQYQDEIKLLSATGED